MTWLRRSQQCGHRITGAKRDPAARAERFDPLASFSHDLGKKEANMIDRVTPIPLGVTKAEDVAAACGDVQIIVNML
jgi:hypothetical protein